VQYFCGYLAPYFHFLAPAALMLATLYTMWNFCRHSEITAMRASGVSFIAIVKPVLAVAVFVAVFVAWVNESYVPAKAQWAAQMRTDRFDMEKASKADNLVYRNAAAGRIWNVDNVLDGDGRKLRNVRLTFDREGCVRMMSVFSERVDYIDGEWWFTRPQIQHFAAADCLFNADSIGKFQKSKDLLAFGFIIVAAGSAEGTAVGGNVPIGTHRLLNAMDFAIA
jgi:lipopolysaccharide export LptBFGC system permease protein LptF